MLVQYRVDGDESGEKYRLGDYTLIQCKILQTNILRVLSQTVRRITSAILGVKGLSSVGHIFHI